MLGVVGHRDRVVDEKHRNAVLDADRAAKPGVVEELIVDQQQWPAVFRTDEDAQQLFVEHGRRLADAEVDARILALVRRDPGGCIGAMPGGGWPPPRLYPGCC